MSKQDNNGNAKNHPKKSVKKISAPLKGIIVDEETTRRLLDYSLRPKVKRPNPSDDSPNEGKSKQDTPQKDSSSESSVETG